MVTDRSEFFGPISVMMLWIIIQDVTPAGQVPGESLAIYSETNNMIADIWRTHFDRPLDGSTMALQGNG